MEWAVGVRVGLRGNSLMPSPFPAFDPWLEDPALWPNFHGLLISAANELLRPQG